MIAGGAWKLRIDVGDHLDDGIMVDKRRAVVDPLDLCDRDRLSGVCHAM